MIQAISSDAALGVAARRAISAVAEAAGEAHRPVRFEAEQVKGHG